jgi:hypothetical protein
MAPDARSAESEAAYVVEFIGIYDADATVWGELTYWVGARLGRRHCALCDITHGMFTRRREWMQCAEDLPVDFHAYHRNDAPPDALGVASGSFPVVLARRSDQMIEVVLDAGQLEALEASPQRLLAALVAALA